MKRGIGYGIAEPCPENWNTMIPRGKGRFCASCQKTVVDFTNMSLPAIHQYMQQAEGSVCGRMTTHQLQLPLNNNPITTTYRFSLQALVLGTALTTFTAFTVAAQGEVLPVKGKVETKETVRGEVTPMCVSPEKKDSVFSGYVVDYRNDVFQANVSVTLYDQDANELATTLTNESGAFLIPLDPEWMPYKAVFRKKDLPDTIFYFESVTSTIGTVIEMTKEAEFIMGFIIKD